MITEIGGLERNVLVEALAALRHTTGLHTEIVGREPLAPGARTADGRIHLHGGDGLFDIFIKIKPRIDRRTTLHAALLQVRQVAGEQGILVTDYLTNELATYCHADLGLQFIDTAGNAYLRRPGLFVLIKGQPRPTHATPAETARVAATPTAMRITFLLLCEPAFLNAPYREIARAAGVALGAVGPVLDDLAERRYLVGGKKKRRFLEQERLFDEWAINYPIRLRPKLHARRFAAENADWWRDAELPADALWGGEVAAERLTHHLRPAACTIYVRPERAAGLLAELVPRHGLRAQPDGNTEILEMFWTLPEDPQNPRLVPPTLVYADLTATMEPRNVETARLLRKQIIEDHLRPA